MELYEHIQKNCPAKISDCTNEQLYIALAKTASELSVGNERSGKKKKKLYYISAEFLIGKLLSNNLINLGIYDKVKKLLEENGKLLSEIEEIEPEPELGNGGLGRLAACFLDSVSTLSLNGDGVGLCYHFGLFRQVFKDNLQTEEKGGWMNDYPFLEKADTSFCVQFRDFSVKSKLYDLDVVGCGGYINKLHLFDIEGIDESSVKDGIIFDKSDIERNLTLFLYPDDSDEKGKLLRIYQQYFMVSCAAQMILYECEQKGGSLRELPDYAVIQINDTHPTLIIPELIRLLCERGIFADEAIDIVRRTCAYTNHTILAEALEKWPVEYLNKVCPQLMPIIEILDNKVRRQFDNPTVNIIDKDERVHMAHIDIHYGFSVNGVAELHTEILKNSELNAFYKLYPEKFNNKTNGITFRRWLLNCNPLLCEFISSLIGDGYKKDASELEKLKAFADDNDILIRLLEIKHENKLNLAEYLYNTQRISLDTGSVFDMQIKRLHEYKRQQLNVLYLINKYLEIKGGKLPNRKITAIFGAKSSPAYVIAKDIIHLILCLSELISNDKEVSQYLNVSMVENYNVTLAEKLIPACDISEQISLASKEASGTGNMKFILNGGVILGTEDGANVEIHELVGDDNIYIFGDDSKTVIERYKSGDYNAKAYYEKDKRIKNAVDFITDKKMLALGSETHLKRLQNELIKKDWFMTFPDFDSYVKVKEQALSDFDDRLSWARKMLMNISCSGFFSSDRTVSEYNKEIWKLN